MAGLISPKPLSYMQHAGQFNPYQQRFSAGTTISAYSETPTILQSHQSHILGFQEESKIYTLVIELLDPNTREAALLELSKKREQYDDLALVLWHSFGMSPSITPALLSPTFLVSIQVSCLPFYRKLSRFIPFYHPQTSPPTFRTACAMPSPSYNVWPLTPRPDSCS